MGIKKYILLTLLMAMVRISAVAQQDPVYSQYMFNMLSINPAYAGDREVLSVTGIYRSQWNRVEGGAQTQLFSADFSIRNKRIGIGMQVFNDDIAVLRNTGLYGMYSYRVHLNDGVLSFGLQTGFLKYNANYNNLLLYDYTDQAFMQNQNEIRVNFGAGVFFKTDRFYAGMSIPHLTGHGRVSVSGENRQIYEQVNHWFFTSGYVFTLNPDLVLKPSILLRAVAGAPLHADLNANLWFLNIAAIGVSYRTSEAVVGMLEIQVNQQFRLGYAYDVMLSNLGAQSTHEFMLRYEFGYSKRNLVSPRYF